MTQVQARTQQLSDLMKKADDLVGKAVELSEEEQHVFFRFLTHRLILQKAQTDIRALKNSSEEGNSTWSGKSLLQFVDDLNAEIPEEILAQRPSDGAEEHDHYIYGTPKKSARS